MFDTHVTVVGNLVAEPRLSHTKDGQAVASFRLASTPRRFDRATGEWRDGDTLFTSVTCWRALAENVSASLKKGCSVIVLGRLSVRPYETKEGEKRQSVDIDAIAVGTDLGRVITVIKRVERGTPILAEAAKLAKIVPKKLHQELLPFALECAAQTAAVWEALRRSRDAGASGLASPKTGYLVSIRDVVLYRHTIPADADLIATVRLTALAPPLANYGVDVSVEGACALRGTIGTYLSD